MGMIKATDAVYEALWDAFQNAKQPLTVSDLTATPAVLNAAMSHWDVDKVRATELLSTRLSFMWRKRVIDRFPAPPSYSFSKYAYGLPGRFNTPELLEPESVEPKPVKRETIEITESDKEITVELKHCVIIIKPK